MKSDARKGKHVLPKLRNASKSVKLLRSGRGRKRGKGKLQVNSKNNRVPFVVPLRRSARNAERVAKVTVQNSKLKKRKRGRPRLEKNKSKKPKNNSKNNSWKKQRMPVVSSYWLNGLRFSRKPGDTRHLRNRKLLVLSGEVDCILNKTKCSLCLELEHKSELNYVGCEICGGNP